MIKIATIGGSDASGGAGLEADLKTFAEYGLYGMAALTTIATMDPAKGWAHSVYAIPEAELRAQCETVFAGVGCAAAKSGMLGTEYAVGLAAEYLKKYKIEHYVLDPVMVCKGANEPLNPELNTAMAAKLLPIAEIVTPNLFEASQLAGMAEVATLDDMKEAAKRIADKGARWVFVKGGAKLKTDKDVALDILYDGSVFHILEAPLIHTGWNHGAGCTTSAAICSGLARDLPVPHAVALAKKFITQSLNHGFPLNKWVGTGTPNAWRNVFS
jgi:pyridoxine kinase